MFAHPLTDASSHYPPLLRPSLPFLSSSYVTPSIHLSLHPSLNQCIIVRCSPQVCGMVFSVPRVQVAEPPFDVHTSIASVCGRDELLQVVIRITNRRWSTGTFNHSTTTRHLLEAIITHPLIPLAQILAYFLSYPPLLPTLTHSHRSLKN